ncbi:hypothetical protein BDY19DRAFT_917081 [Irpex rosettiformis]|uniref:Uncharacterized protein n=1 Tax=Irpex rosettiformis TaxID=378272 RepID=A0ACB8ULJ7_9APHY|nr:hypothetical protein BDY19DRAFT_917081 [Irpex rosettiformis]
MKERGVGKPWTKQEDDLLTQAVRVHGENDNWKAIALCVPGRTNKACRKRWLHSLSPYVKKTAWTQDEDQLLLRLYDKHGPKWSAIAREIPGRTDDACSKRYREALDPSLKRDEWTQAEDDKLLRVQPDKGVQWGQIGRELNRSGLACRNRWRMLNRKKAQGGLRNDHSQTSDTLLAGGPTESNADVPSNWNPSVSFQEPTFWDATDTQQYPPSTDLTQEDSASQFAAIPSSAYLSPDYSVSEMPEHVQPSVPFNYSSSSLSAALSLAAVSPSSTHMNSPITNQTSPFPLVNDTQFLNAGQGSISSQSSVLQEHLIPATQSYLSPSPTSSSSPDLSALGSQDLTVPIPFDDSSPETYSPNYDSAVGGSQPPIIEVTTTYPTPVASPIIDESMPFAPEQDHPAEQAAARHYRTSTEKRLAESKTASPKKSSRHSVKGGPPRLSASLPASDNVPAYVCGHESCWLPGESRSTKCYRTSQELYDHWKVEHSDDAVCERPYRCGLPDCGKGWKSINGLQYHLQLSKAHFQKAISASITPQPEVPVTAVNSVSAGVKKKMFGCPRPGCTNQYKQMSGLRYHLTHGHTQQLPHQLTGVPPALARKVADRLHPPISPQETSPLQFSAHPGQ